MRIAIADDERDLRDYFLKVLTRLGHQVIGQAENGRQLVEFCRQDRPDLVITDVRMPEMDGLEAAGVIQQEGPIPVLLVTAHNDPDMVSRAGNQNIVGMLVKPVSRATLEPAIDAAMDRFAQLPHRRTSRAVEKTHA